MSETAEVQTILDLSHLPYETRLWMAAAKCIGAKWRRSEGTPDSKVDHPRWLLNFPDGGTYVIWDSGETYATPGLHFDFLHDPAAWAPVMVKEMARWETGEFDGERQHRCWWHSGDGVTLTPGPWAPDLPRAVCLAVLAKHGITVEP